MTLIGLVVVLGALVVLARHRRHAGDSHEDRRINRLLDATSRTAKLRSFEEALTTAAAEACALSDADVGLCCAMDARGVWSGMLVDGDGPRAASIDAIEALRELVTEDPSAREVDLRALLLPVRLALPPARTLVVACSTVAASTPVVIAGLRDARPSTGESPRSVMLGRFVSQAALSVANARLYEEVDTAYRQQLDLNRQKGEFVATVSHELRTPVAAIMGTIETISRLGDRLDHERRSRLLDGAVEYGERLSRLIEELLLVAATEHSTTTVRVTDIDLDALIDRVVSETTAVTGGRVTATVKPSTGRIRSDESKLHRVLVNLIENAAKYAPSGPIEIEAMAAGARLLCFVTDHGPGIPTDDRDRVFERFVQLDQSLTRRQGGLGLGLYLCRQLAGVLGGELVLTETPGGGCSFCLAVDRDLPGGETDDTPTQEPANGVMRRPAESGLTPAGRRVRRFQVAG